MSEYIVWPMWSGILFVLVAILHKLDAVLAELKKGRK